LLPVLSAALSGLAFWPGLLLAVAGVVKARQARTGDGIATTVVGRLVGRRMPLRPTWTAIAAVELGVGGLVLSAQLAPWPEAAAGLVLAVAAGLAFWGLRTVPGADCGCFGLRKRVRPKTIIRAALLSALAFAAAAGGEGWTAVLRHPAALVPLAAAGVALVWLSSELYNPTEAVQAATMRQARYRKAQLRRARYSACERRAGPVERTVAGLQRTDLWQRARPYIAAEEPTEHWVEGCTRLLCYPAVYEGESATAVFAVNLGLRQHGTTVAFVNEEEQRVLARLDAKGAAAS